jgi:arylsulfatase A
MFKRRDFLKSVGLGAAGAFFMPRSLFAKQSSARRPNFIYILVDDLGYSELGCYGNTFNETPNLDKLAHQGVRFTDAYAAAPVCSPYRAALMTGQWPARVGITDFLRPDDANHLSTEHITMAEMFKTAGYATGMIGKWHLSGYGSTKYFPPAHGFDETIISEKRGIGRGDYFFPYRFNREVKKRLPGREHLIDRQNLEAVEFIERHKDHPFFLYLSHYAVHTILDGRKDLVARYSKKPGAGRHSGTRENNPHLAAQIEVIDTGVGMIMKKLKDLGLADNTVIVFTSDNGGESLVTNNAPLRAGKSTLYEGGIREPLIVRYPAVVPQGAVCNTPTSNVDFYPTFAQIAGTTPDPGQHLDGVSILPLLKNPGANLKRDALYWHYPLSRPHFLGGRSSGAIRQGDWKLIEFFDTGEVELYNLADDIGETQDLAKSMPAKAAELKKRLADWRISAGADIPEDCRDYDPDKFFMDPIARWVMRNIIYSP